MKQNFLVLLRSRLLVSVVDLLQVVVLLVKHNPDVLDGIEQVEVLAVLVRFEVQIVKQLHESGMILSDFDIGRDHFNLPL